MATNFASDYVDVATRIAEAKAVYPDLVLQAEIVAMSDERVTMRAFAYRTPDDPRPGIGHAWEVIPGRTPFTRGSELMVCETSAWGRALAALGIATRAGIATREEVEAAQGRNEAPRPAPRQVSERSAPVPAGDGLTVGQAMDALKIANVDKRKVSEVANRVAGTWSLKEMTPQQRAAVVAELTGMVPVPETSASDFDDMPF
jgi:hypothetical protein